MRRARAVAALVLMLLCLVVPAAQAAVPAVPRPLAYLPVVENPLPWLRAVIWAVCALTAAAYPPSCCLALPRLRGFCAGWNANA